MVMSFEEAKITLQERGLVFSESTQGGIVSLCFYNDALIFFLDFYDTDEKKLKGLAVINKKKNKQEYYESIGDYLSAPDSQKDKKIKNTFCIYTENGKIDLSLNKIRENKINKIYVQENKFCETLKEINTKK